MPYKIDPAGQAHPIDIHVGSIIAANRRRLGMSQSDVGREIGVTFQQMQKYERGQNRVSASRLHQIAGVLNLPVSAFFPAEGATLATEVPPLSRQAAEIGRLAPQLRPSDQKVVLELISSLIRRTP